MAVKLGSVVQYQPTAAQSPMTQDPQTALVTAFDEASGKVSLAVFAYNGDYLAGYTGVSEGDGDGHFMELGRQSATQKAKAEAKAAQEKQAAEDAKKAQQAQHAHATAAK